MALAVLDATPSIENVEDLGDGYFRSKVVQSSFPLVTLTPVMKFKVSEEAEARSVSVTLVDQVMEAEGPSWAVRVVLAAAEALSTESTTVFKLEDGVLVGEAFVDVSMNLPRWVPVPRKTIQKGGQKSMEEQIQGDLRLTLETLSKS